MRVDYIILLFSGINLLATLFIGALVLDLYGDIQEMRRENRGRRL